MKRIFAFVLTLALAAALTAPALAAEFTDVPADHYARAAIEECAGKGIVSGYNDGTFRPANTVTKGHFTAMLARAFYAELAARYDTEQCRETYGAFGPTNLALAANGTLNNTSFRYKYANASAMSTGINRYDMAQMMANILALSGVTVSDGDKITAASKLTDYGAIITSDYASYGDAIATVCALGVITGYADGTFSGAVTMNRAQACAVISRLSKVLEDAEFQAEDPADPEPAPEEKPVQIEPTPEEKPVQTEPAPEEKPGLTLADGQEITEDNVRTIILSLKSEYPEGRPWTNDNTYSPNPYLIAAGCAGFAWICSDAAFGDLPVSETHSDFSRIRAGDMIRMNNDTHSVVALEVNGDTVTVTEGNYNSSIHWGRSISRQTLEQGNFSVETRYPA